MNHLKHLHSSLRPGFCTEVNDLFDTNGGFMLDPDEERNELFIDSNIQLVASYMKETQTERIKRLVEWSNQMVADSIDETEEQMKRYKESNERSAIWESWMDKCEKPYAYIGTDVPWWSDPGVEKTDLRDKAIKATGMAFQMQRNVADHFRTPAQKELDDELLRKWMTNLGYTEEEAKQKLQRARDMKPKE